MEWTSGNGSGASGTSSTVDNKSSMVGADEKLGAAEYRGGWITVTRCPRRQGGRKVRARRQGGSKHRAGDGDGTGKARRQRTGAKDDANGATALPQAAEGSAHGGE